MAKIADRFLKPKKTHILWSIRAKTQVKCKILKCLINKPATLFTGPIFLRSLPYKILLTKEIYADFMKIKNRPKWLSLKGGIITPHRNADFLTRPWLFRDAKCLTRFHYIRFRIESIVVLVSKLEIFGLPSREWWFIIHPQNWESS